MKLFALLFLCLIFVFVNAQGGPPLAAPRNVKVETISDSILWITWEAPSKSDWDGEISSYKIRYIDMSDSKYETTFSFCRKENCTHALKNLEDSTQYGIDILAYNLMGEGPTSATVIQTTGSFRTTGSRPNFPCEAISSTELRVSWLSIPPDVLNGTLKGYKVIYAPKDLFDDESKRDYKKTANNETVLHGLKENTIYAIKVAAMKSEGVDIEGLSFYCVTEEVDGIPEPPELVKCEAISSTELRVSWENISSYSLHGTFKTYTVDYSLRYPFESKWESKNTSTNETVLSGLKKDTDYMITVCALNSKFDGFQSIPIPCRTEKDVPDEPVNVKVVVYGTEKVRVLWRAPLSQHSGDILHYTVYYQNSGNEAKAAEVEATQTNYEIFGLEPNKLYEFWVSASNGVGEGPASEYLTGILSNETPSKIATYNNTVTVKFKKTIALLCDPVGLPMPHVFWKVNGDDLIPNERLQILANGTLIIKSVMREDANNYTCIAVNAFGNDSVTHELIVLAPPKSPEVTILSTTTDEITLGMKPNSTDSAANRGFKLFYKLDSEIKPWKKVNVISQSYKIEHCKCGSPYRIYAFGYNDIGDGDATEILTVRTNGSKPVAPRMSTFIERSAEAITLHLSSWSADSCPITHFFVEFKEKNNSSWVKIRNKLRPNTDFNLNSKAVAIRVTAYNAAGTTKADYEVAKM